MIINQVTIESISNFTELSRGLGVTGKYAQKKDAFWRPFLIWLPALAHGDRLPGDLRTLPSRLPKPPKPRPTYRNPIYRAKEYARMIESGQAKNESDLARKIGISRVRVCQYVRLLSLDASIVKALEQLGDPFTDRVITERRLSPI